MLLNTYQPHYTETQFIFGYLRPFLGLRLLLLYLCNLFFIFSVIFIAINHITSVKQPHLLFVYFSQKIPEFLCNKITSPQFESLLKQRPWYRCISAIFAKFLKAPFFIEPIRVFTSGSSCRYLKLFQILY